MKIRIDNILKMSTNKIYAGIHYRTRTKHKENYRLITKTIFNKLEPIEGKVDLSFTFYFAKNALDSSNCSYMAKMIEDCLVEYGVLKDDTIKYVGKFSVTSFKSENKEKDYCILEILI